MSTVVVRVWDGHYWVSLLTSVFCSDGGESGISVLICHKGVTGRVCRGIIAQSNPLGRSCYYEQVWFRFKWFCFGSTCINIQWVVSCRLVGCGIGNALLVPMGW